MKNSFHPSFLILILLFTFLSCTPPTQILVSEKNKDNQTIEISSVRFKTKGEWFNQIDGKITDKEGKWLFIYHISTKCGCLTKTDYRKGIKHYKAVDQLNYDFVIDSLDKFMLMKFASLPDIENYCSKSLLYSAKGFIRD